MQIENVPYMVTEWNNVPTVIQPGEKGFVSSKMIEVGNIRVRIVEYSPGYIADHWCTRGHVILVLDGELITELNDGRIFILKPGMSYQVASNAEAHKSSSKIGAKLFITD